MTTAINNQPEPEIEIRDKAPGHREALPTFPLEYGWREYWDEEVGKRVYTPLTLSDIVFPIEEEDIGTVTMKHGDSHEYWRLQILALMQQHLDARWVLLSHILVRWPYPDSSPTFADITAIPEGKYAPDQEGGAFVVLRDGPYPDFFIEITSELTRPVDIDRKPIIYAAEGVKEYLVIDILTPEDEEWQLTGYRLGKEVYYHKLEPDVEGGLTFDTVGLRFISVGRERIELYDSVTNEQLHLQDDEVNVAE